MVIKTKTAALKIKRAYDPAADDDGVRMLVDRLWPRGMSKDEARVDVWLKDIAPSDELRKWFSHDPAKWAEFRKRYERELEQKKEFVQQIIDMLAEGRVTLLYSAKDDERNNAVVLREFIAETLKRRRS